MNLDLENKIALVTGGSRGLGLACAKALAAEGVRVAIVSRDPASVARAKGELAGAVGFDADLRDEAVAGAAVDRVENDLGPIDILVNAAGAAARRPPDELTPSLWRAAMDAKFFTYVNVMDPLIKRMAARRSGVVVNLIGSGGKVATPTHISGGAANAALMLATAGLAAAYASRGVQVVGLNPGHTHTDRVAQGLEADARLHGLTRDEAYARLVARVPMGRLGEPEEIAAMVVFLASPRASYVTGVNISMDGATDPVVV